MRKAINTVTIILYVIFFIAAVVCGYLDTKLDLPLWIACVSSMAAMLVVGIIRHYLLKYEKAKAKKDNAVRVVKVQPTKVIGEEVNHSITEKIPLIHVDNVDERKVVVSIYKEKVLATDSVGTITK